MQNLVFQICVFLKLWETKTFEGGVRQWSAPRKGQHAELEPVMRSEHTGCCFNQQLTQINIIFKLLTGPRHFASMS